MSKERELLKKVLATQEKYYGYGLALHVEMIDIAKEIRSELAKPEPEPFAWFDDETADVWVDPVRPEHKDGYKIPLYTSPQNQIPLTDSDIRKIYAGIPKFNSKENIQILFARAIETAIREGR